MVGNDAKTLIVTAAPHIKAATDTRRIMLYVLIALLPPVLMGTYVFGIGAIMLTAVCALSAVFFEWAYEKLMKKDVTVGDLSAAVTGVILACNLPSNFPVWMALIGVFTAIVIVKQLFGGLGKNIANPAIVGRIVLLLSFTSEMTTWPVTRLVDVSDESGGIDALTGATPLAKLADGQELPELSRMFIGFTGGTIGEVSAIAILIGGLFLIWKKVIQPVIPCVFIGMVFATAFIYYSIVPGPDSALQMALFHIFAGGLMFGAFFCATDYVTSPILTRGKVIFAIGCGLVTMVIRLFGSYPEGVSFAILFMNVLTPLIDDFAAKTLYQGMGGAGNEE